MNNFVFQKNLIFVLKFVSIIYHLFIAMFNWNTIFIEYRLIKKMEKDLQARLSGSIWKTTILRFIETRLAFLLSIAECKLIAIRLSLFQRISFSCLFFHSHKLVATFFIWAGREHLEHRRSVTMTAPMIASPSMLSEKEGDRTRKILRRKSEGIGRLRWNWHSMLEIRDRNRKRTWFLVQQ